ncbi:MAG: PIN domain-containing protein [Candidatus Rokubacteria bacterium]|nr:PIN domain-containing protein [Candidatus Rokubacteria bacterium]
MILLDTSGLLSAIDGSQRQHAASAAALSRVQGPLLLSPFVLAELDYLLATRVGAGAQRALLEEVARGAYQLEPFGAPDVTAALEVIDRYADLRIGLADASIVVLARRHGVRDVLTLDARHFRALRPSPRGRFRLLPQDP